jgi:hypothetical protein
MLGFDKDMSDKSGSSLLLTEVAMAAVDEHWLLCNFVADTSTGTSSS